MEGDGHRSRSSDFGMLLRRYRIAAGLSQGTLAERARLSLYGISALERGYRRSPQRETLALLAGALALNEDQLQEFEAAAARPSTPRRREASVTIGPWPEGRTLHLPLSLSTFVGRDVELREIAALLRRYRLVTLTGTGGIGKTQTALRVAAAPRERDAPCFVGLAPITGSSSVVTAIALALGVQEVPNHPLLETLVAYLKNKAFLLILDNCEHLVRESAIVVNTLLLGCPLVRILATSREPLKAAGERAYRLPSLAEKDATALFVDRALAADSHFTVSDRDKDVVATLCRRLDGIPLAIELAAARVNLLPLEKLAAKLDDRFRILSGGERTALARQQTMRATIDWSYDLLSASEQRLFERLSIFAGGCTLTAASRVCAGEGVAESEVLDLLSSLVEKSLVTADLETSEPRYRLLESFRQYAREKLAQRGEDQAVARRHAIAALDVARFGLGAFEGSTPWIREESANLRAAVEWALIEGNDALLGQELAGVLCQQWTFFLESRRWIAAAIQLAHESMPLMVLALLDIANARVAADFDQYEIQLASAGSALARYRALKDPVGSAKAQWTIAEALYNLGRVAECKPLLLEALAVARTSGSQNLLNNILRALGVASAIARDVVAARAYFTEVLRNYKTSASKFMIGLALGDLGECEFSAGDPELALRYGRETLAAARANTVGWRAEVMALNNISRYLVSLARFDEAQASACQALDLARERQWDVLVAWNLENLAAVACLRPQKRALGLRSAYPIAAEILGFTGARLAALGSTRDFSSQPQYDRVLSVLSEALGADVLAALMTKGATMTEEQAVVVATQL